MSDDEFVKSGLVAAIKTASNLEKRIAELERENAALRADKARLDWLFTNSGSAWVYRFLRHNYVLTRVAIDAAIDAARKEAQP